MLKRCFISILVAAGLVLLVGIVSVPSSYAAAGSLKAGPYGPYTCRSGYVWREAYNGDHVCVTPQRRAQVAYDNRMARHRINRGGGIYGRNTCRSGYVWRVARASDLVCVTPNERSLVAEENRLAPFRYAP
ncbi:MAG TPA: hypothetical protein VL485_16625 [Ktedonobacteraceae bacterium]|jgi:hypothetical protein|nr:hypothetical protein [Ktedonobacteraceae bacterium]